MARMSKRISNKITKTKEQQNAPKEQKKYGKDIWLILLIVINFLLLVTMWESLILAPISFATYLVLEIALVIMYANRHAKVSDNVREWLYKAQIFFMGIILLLFLYTVVSYIFS